MNRLWTVAAIVSAPHVALATGPARQVEVGFGGDHLGNGAPSWRELDFAWRERAGDGLSWEGTLRQVRRSGQDDTELGATLSRRLDGRWTLSVAGQASPRHRVLPRLGGRIELTRQLDGGWVAGTFLGRRLYAPPTAAGTTNWGLVAERYVGDWRAAASLGQTRLDGGRTTGNARLQIDRWFGDGRGRIGVIVASGREIEALPATVSAPADVLDQRVRVLAVVGAWPFAPDWALTAEAAHTRTSDGERASGLPAGSPYSRNGVRVGVRRDF